MQRQKTYDLVLCALFTAIIIIMAFTPLGYIPLVLINATIIHIPVILGALFLGPKKGAFLGFVFGFTSFLNNTLKAATASAFVFSPVLAVGVVGISGIFRSLYICFIPRILVGIIPYYVYRLIRWILQKGSKVWRVVFDALAALLLCFALYAFFSRLLSDKVAGANIIGLVIGLIAGIALFIALTVYSKNHASANIALAYAGLFGAFTNTFFVMSGIYILYKDAYAKALGIAGEAVLDTIMGVVTFSGVLEAVVAAILVAAIGIALLRVKSIPGTEKSIGKEA